MFGIIYTLLGLGAYGKGLIKQGVHDAKSSADASKTGEPIYVDFRGKYREVGSNELVLRTNDPVSGDYGYIIIDPHSKRLHRFVSLEEPKRRAAWQEAHARFLRGEKNLTKDGSEITVIDYESKKSNLDFPGQKIIAAYSEYDRIPLRLCEGHRYKDIETGRLFVKRSVSTNEWNNWRKAFNKYDVYMDAETGMIVREDDEAIAGHNWYYNSHSGDKEMIVGKQVEAEQKWNAFKEDFNKKQEEKLRHGVRERDPKSYFMNSPMWDRYL